MKSNFLLRRETAYLLLTAALLLLPHKTALAENVSLEQRSREIQIQQKKEQLLIKARQRIAAQEAQEKAVPRVEEREKPLLPEIPQPLRDRELGPAEKIRLNDLEQKYAAGKISETEYKLEKDSLVRGTTIKF